MISNEALRTLRERLATCEPLLSLYLDVNPANPDNARQAPLHRARAAMGEAGLPAASIRALIGRLRLEEVIPQGRTLVVFATLDPDGLFEPLYLQAELPFPGSAAGVAARWGAAFLTPLAQAIDEQERCGVVYVDQRRWRYFEVFLGEIVEVEAAERPVEDMDWRRFEESKPGMPGVPARGGSGKDMFDRRMWASSQRFYRRVARVLQEAIHRRAIARIIVMGPPEHVHAFEAVLPPAVQALIVQRLPPPADPNVSAHTLAPVVLPVIEQAERGAEMRLLDGIRERGIWGVQEVLHALLEGRLHHLVVSSHADQTLYRCTRSGRLAASLTQAAQLCPDGRFELVRLGDVVWEMAETWGVKLEFVRGEAEERLRREFGGLAGLPRW